MEVEDEEEGALEDSGSSDREGALLKLPLEITVELTRLRMNASDLLKLSKGDLIDLKLSPQAGVSLTVHGKTIGRGELVKVEDLLFVRLLQL